MKTNNNICAILNSNKNFKELEPLSRNRPVSSLPFACRYRIIDFMLSSVSHADIQSVALFIDTSGRSLYDHIRGAREWNLNTSVNGGIFTFSQQKWKRERFLEGNQPTAEGFYADHKVFMSRSNVEYVLVMSGEYIVNIDVNAVVNYFKDTDIDATVVYKNLPYDVVKGCSAIRLLDITPEGKISSIQFKQCDEERVNLNLEVYVLKVDIMKEIIDQAEEDGFYEDIGTVLHHYLKDYNVNGFEYTGYHAIIDSIETYYKHNMEMLDTSKFNSLFNSSLPIITRTKNGTPTFYADSSDVRATLSATSCDLYGTIESSLIFRNVCVEEEASVFHSIILPRCTIEKGATVSYVILDKGVVVEEGVTLKGEPNDILVIPKNTRVTKEWKR